MPRSWRLLVGVTGLTIAAAATAVPLFTDSFAGPEPATGWERDVSPGNEVSVRNGRLLVRARTNTYAHLQRPVGADNVNVSALLQPSVPSGVSWAAGIFLYWSPGAWCQLGIIDFEGGQYYAVEATSGSPAETYLARCDRTRPHWLRIELGQDVVRYLTRADDEAEWAVQRVIPRPDEYAGPPKLLVVGKGYGRDDGYSQADLDNDYSDPGPMLECWFDDVTIAPTPRERLRWRPGETTGRGDDDGERLLAPPGDPTYEQVAAVYPPLRHGREAVGVKWHRQETGVNELGALELRSPVDRDYTMSLTGTLHVGAEGAAFGSGEQRPTKQLLDGYLPVVVATWQHDGITYEETVFGYSEGLSDSAPAYAYVRLKASNSGEAKRLPVAFRLTPEAAGCAPGMATLEAPRSGSSSVAFRVPAVVSPGAVVELVGSLDFDLALAATRRFWRAEAARGMRISVPDQRLMDAYRAWLAYNALDVDRMGDVYDAHDGSAFYEESYGYSAARYAQALDLYGRHDEAAAILRALRSHQQSSGLLDLNFGLTDTGTYLVAIALHYQLTGDADWLRGLAPSVVAACDYLAQRRAAELATDPRVAGLIKHRSYCDYPTPVYGYLHNCYCCVGMEQVAPALRAIGMTAEADRIATEARAYRGDIEASMQAAMITRNGRRMLPLEPDTHRLLRAVGYQARDYYTLVASPLLECGFLAPDGQVARTVTDFLLDCGGIQMGVCEFRGGIDHAYGYGYMEQQLRRGQPERYLLGLYSSLAYGMTRETFSSVECTQHKTGENALTLPHLYSGSQQLFMLRTLLLREEAGKLILGSAAPRAWLGSGRRIAVQSAPTSYGDLSFRLLSENGAHRVRAVIGKPSRGLPRAVELWLRHPQGKAIAGVTINGRPWPDFTAETITIAPEALPCRVVAEYR